MSGLQDFLAPFSHLIFANRNIVIVLVCAVAFWAAMQALKDRWRADKLERDLNASHASASTAPAGRRYATTMDEPAPETGGALPPIKGGRSYARNLGSALQKAGVSSPQIYSPPTPSGFTPNTNQPQPPMAQPGGAPFGAPATPWGAPAQAPTPWAFPAAGARNPVQPPTPAPFYQPQPAAPPAPQPGPFAGQGPAFGAPTFPSPQQPASFPNPVAPSAQAPAAPPMTPAPAPAAPMLPPMPPVAPMASPPADSDANDGGRRGKPKRRRFNFNVLENLEKMVQSKPADTAGASAPVAPASPVPPTAPPAQASVTPAVQPATPAPAPTLPFLFGQRNEPKAPAAPAPAAEPEKAADAAAEPETAEQTLPFGAPAEAAEPAHPEAVSEPAVQEAKPEGRRSMRSMMFGEEIAAAGGDQADAPEPALAEPQASAAPDEDAQAQPQTAESAEAQAPETETSWSQPWKQREEPAADGEMVSAEQEPSSSVTPDAEPPLQPFGSYDPWKPVEPETAEATPAASEPESWTAEVPAQSESSESQPEPVVAEAPALEVESASSEPEPVTEHEPVADSEPVFSAEPVPDAMDETPAGPATMESDRPSAGTLVIIEDDQTAASYYATLFEGHGYHVEVANDGVSGVDLATRVQPQVILLDVMMPRQNGILVLQTLRASDETRNTPVVVMSNFSEPTLIKRALQLGALEYVIKTQVEGPALLNALPRWMNREKAFAAA